MQTHGLFPGDALLSHAAENRSQTPTPPCQYCLKQDALRFIVIHSYIGFLTQALLQKIDLFLQGLYGPGSRSFFRSVQLFSPKRMKLERGPGLWCKTIYREGYFAESSPGPAHRQHAFSDLLYQVQHLLKIVKSLGGKTNHKIEL